MMMMKSLVAITMMLLVHQQHFVGVEGKKLGVSTLFNTESDSGAEAANEEDFTASVLSRNDAGDDKATTLGMEFTYTQRRLKKSSSSSSSKKSSPSSVSGPTPAPSVSLAPSLSQAPSACSSKSKKSGSSCDNIMAASSSSASKRSKRRELSSN